MFVIKADPEDTIIIFRLKKSFFFFGWTKELYFSVIMRLSTNKVGWFLHNWN